MSRHEGFYSFRKKIKLFFCFYSTKICEAQFQFVFMIFEVSLFQNKLISTICQTILADILLEA